MHFCGIYAKVEGYFITNIVFKILTKPGAMCLPIGNCQHISEDMNEDTISVLVRLITEKKGMWPAKVSASPQNSINMPYGPYDQGFLRKRGS